MRAVSHCQGKRRAYSGDLEERQGEMIEVTSEGGTDPLRFTVVVREGQGETRHAVTLAAADFARLGNGEKPERVVGAAFAFLLEREPKEAILSRFDLSVIARYFPEFERELPRYLAP
jgi:hypothetical protein